MPEAFDENPRDPAHPPDERVCVDDSPFDPELLIAYRQHRLDEAAEEDVELHLVRCAYCRQFLREVAKDVPRQLEQLFDRHRPADVRRRRFDFVSKLALAASLALAFMGWWHWPMKPSVGTTYEVAWVRGLTHVGIERGETVSVGGFAVEGSILRIKVEPAEVGDASVSRRPAAETLKVELETEDGHRVNITQQVDIAEAEGVFNVKVYAGEVFGRWAGRKTLHFLPDEDPTVATSTTVRYNPSNP